MGIEFVDRNDKPLKIGTEVIGEFLEGTFTGVVVGFDDYYEPADVNGEGYCTPSVDVKWPNDDEPERISCEYCGHDEDVWMAGDIEILANSTNV